MSSYYIPSIIEKAKTSTSIRYKRMYKMALEGLESGHTLIWDLSCKYCKRQNKNSRIRSFSQYPIVAGCAEDLAEVFPQTESTCSKYSNMSNHYPFYTQEG